MTLIGSLTFTKPWLLLCEGVGDHHFFDHLCRESAINKFDIVHPTMTGSDFGGRENFGAYLNSISISESFIENVRSILIISDKDENAADSFEKVREQLRETDLPVPQQPCKLAAGKGSKSVTVIMIPIEQEIGNLESMCLPAAYSKWGLEEALDRFVEATPAREWSIGKQAKVRLQSMLAAINRKQPDTGFAAHWSKREEFRIPVHHACFAKLVAELRSLAKMYDENAQS